MAKHDHQTSGTATAAPQMSLAERIAATAATVQPEAGAARIGDDSRFKKVTLSDGTTVNRIDYIRARWTAGASRSAIAAELTKLTGQKVGYQIVFSATKDQPGGPAKPDAADTHAENDPANTAEGSGE